MQKWKDRAVMMRTIRRLASALEDMTTDVLALGFEPETEKEDEERIDKSYRRMSGELLNLAKGLDLEDSGQCPCVYGTIQCALQKGHSGTHGGACIEWTVSGRKL